MGESFEHLKYVRTTLDIACELVPSNKHPYVQSDLPESESTPPSLNGGFRPDVYYCDEELLIIGEAKTLKDVETKHSLAQYAAYICEGESFMRTAYMIFVVPWTMSRTIKKTLSNVRTNANVNLQIIIVDDAGNRVMI